MTIDIPTLSLVLSITNLLQVITLFAQSRMDETHHGPGWWTLGMAALGLGFAAANLRAAPSLTQIAIVIYGALIIAGQTLLYIGILRFFDRRERRGPLIAFWAVYLLVTIYFTYGHPDVVARRAIFYAALGAQSFLAARALFIYKTRSVAGSAYLLAIVYLAQGSVLGLVLLVTVTSPPDTSLLAASPAQVATFLEGLIVTTLLTFGFILLVNQRLRTDNRDDKERLELIFNTSPDAVLISGLKDGRFVEINDGFTALTGFTRADVIDKSSLDLHIWRDPAERQKIVMALKENGVCENLEISLLHKDGHPFVGMLSARLITLRGLPTVLGVIRDITGRKQMVDALRESEAKMRAIAESARDAILMLDPAGRVSYWNPAAERILGYTAGEALGHNLHELIAPDRYRAEHRAAFPAFAQTGQGDVLGKSHDVFARRKDGTEIPVQLSLAGFQLNGGWYAVGILSDITERKRLEAELAQQATTDELTGISNRRHFLALAQSELKRALRLKHPLALVLFDVDRLKHINDSYGHAAGDQALKAFTEICQKSIREIDVFARFGGDEFALLLPEANRGQAVTIVTRVRLALASHPLDLDGQSVDTITVSSGIASLAGEAESLDMLLGRADQALYQAKESGRDCVVVEELDPKIDP